MDAAHFAKMLVVDIVGLRARVKLEGCIGGQRWWVIDRFFPSPGGEVSEKKMFK